MKLTKKELELIQKLREQNPSLDVPSYDKKISFSDNLADKITEIVGSWRFLIIQSFILVCWIIINITAYIHNWDPYPFILLNLILSFQAAYTAPIIMMSQNRSADIDRKKLEYYYNVNVKSELEVELLHHKVDLIMQKLEIEDDSRR